LLHEERGEVFAYVTDQVGVPRELVDGAGRVAWAGAFTAFGQLVEERRDEARAWRVESPFRLLGQVYDEESGLSWTRFRCFDAETGRWLSADPIGLKGGLDTLGFNGSPTDVIDPLGLAFARVYSLDDARSMLGASEGRPSPVSGQPGHAQERHAAMPNEALQKRATCEGGKRTTYDSRESQARALRDALNSSQGQAKLSQLDSNATLKRVSMKAPTGAETVRIAQPGGGYITRQTSRQGTVVVDRLPGPGENLHVQTAYGHLSSPPSVLIGSLEELWLHASRA
jgi:RHS repeat-associated protein